MLYDNIMFLNLYGKICLPEDDVTWEKYFYVRRQRRIDKRRLFIKIFYIYQNLSKRLEEA